MPAGSLNPNQVLQHLTQQTQQTTIAFTTLAEKITAAAGQMEEAMKKATLTVAGFVTAGLAASNESNVLAYHFKELSFQIASLFAPAIHRAIDALREVVLWFRNLSGEPQEMLRHLIEGAAAVYALGYAFRFLGIAAGPLTLIVQLLAAVLLQSEEARDSFGELVGSFAGLMTSMAGLLDSIMQLAQPLIDLFTSVSS